jgi:Na+-driven multidrug efflux pump
VIVDHREIRGTLARLAIPVFAATVGDQFLGIADTIVIGTFGPAALAAITGATAVFVTLAMALHGVSQGAGILAAQAIGAGNTERFGRIARASILVPSVLGVGLAVAALWLAEPAMPARGT